MRERGSSVRDGWCPDSESPRRSRRGGDGGARGVKTTAAPHRAGGGCVATGGF